jgi:cytoplasmic iron level regulating protein YaaA (DUF328/UPF0246 family)
MIRVAVDNNIYISYTYKFFMRKIVLISCVSVKQERPARAEELYISPLFKYGLAYAKSLKPDKIYILSAKYGLVGLDEVIEPYNVTLNNMSSMEIKEWSEKVLSKMRQTINLDVDQIIFLAGENYRKYLMPYIKNYSIPLKGLGIGKQLKYLKEHSGKHNE